MIGDIEFPSIEIIDTCKILKDFNLCVIYNLGGFFWGGDVDLSSHRVEENKMYAPYLNY